MVLLEICANSIQSALNAQEGGADRIELCQNLEQGGVTPSFGLIKHVKSLLKIPVFVLIRPRPGDFVYTEDEIIIMEHDIKVCKEHGVDGVVLGVLTPDRRVDVERTKRLVKTAGDMEVTFHRAFDEISDRWQGVKDVMATGCSRLLTSGGLQSCVSDDGVDELKLIQARVQDLGNRLTIVAGGGINVDNVNWFMENMTCKEIHASCKRKLSSSGGLFGVELFETDVDSVRNMMEVVRRYS